MCIRKLDIARWPDQKVEVPRFSMIAHTDRYAWLVSRSRTCDSVELCRVDFAACANASAQRHFGKIMADLLGRYAPESGDLERIAETAAGWAVSPEAKVAVKVWAVEVLKRCRERVGWVAESWDDIVEAVALDATPGIESRMRKSWKTKR